jgi:hypothetical protein
MGNGKQQASVLFLSSGIENDLRLFVDGKISRDRFLMNLYYKTEKAKDMHKREIENAVDGFPIENRNLTGTEYYNERFEPF